MWPGQRQSLTVWADELQARGEPLGELIASSLRADELMRSARVPTASDSGTLDLALLRAQEQARAVAKQTETLRRALAPTLLGPELAALPTLRLRWRCGLVRGIELEADPQHPTPDPELVAEVLAALLARPVCAWLERVVLEPLAHGLDPLLDALAAEGVRAQPRVLVLGRWPGHFRRCHDLMMRRARGRSHWYTQGRILKAAVGGLSWLVRDGELLVLPWATGDANAHLERLAELLAGPWTEASTRRLAQACWDSSMRVRREIFAKLPELPDELAPLLPVLLAQLPHSQRIHGDRLERCAARIASTRPSWVGALAQNFGSQEVSVARWLAGVGRRTRSEAANAIPEISAMLDEMHATGQEGRPRAIGLERALAQFPTPRLQPLRAPSAIDERAQQVGSNTPE